jgi:tetratricopeptide (TPR) repeat protein
MNRTLPLLKFAFIILVLLSTVKPVNSQNSLLHNTDKNTLVNFSEALQYWQDFGEKKSNNKYFNISLNNYGYLLLVKSLGESRNISAEKKEFLDFVFKAIGVYEQAKNLFNKEVLVDTDAGKYWFPIQDALLGFWHDELKSGDQTLIYIRFYGSMSNNSEGNCVFTINAFNSGYYDGLWEEAMNNFNDGKDTIGLRCVKKLISLDPNDGRNHAMLGFHYTMVGAGDLNNQVSFTKADSLFSIAEKLTPEYSYQYFQRAILKFHMHDYVQAWKYIEKAKSMNEERIEQYFIDDLELKLPYVEYLKAKK